MTRMKQNDVTAADISDACTRLRGVITETPLQRNLRLSLRTGANVWLKREDLQPVRSYKIRGAYNLISQLSTAERQAGVVCASAGNHGQGVAYACARLGIRARIFVPSTTPRQKRDRMRQLGGAHVELVVTGDTYDEAAQGAYTEVWESGATMVPAFDDPRTVAGQGTLAAEVVDQLGHAPDVLVVPVGGGGMLGGCLVWFAEHHPDTRIVAVEPAGAANLAAAMAHGAPVTLDHIETFVDGAAVRRAGDLTTALALAHQPEPVAVPEGQICSEMLELYQTDGIIAEPAGALAAASLGRQLTIGDGQSVVAILSGGNNDVSRYSEIVERSLVWEGRKHYFLVNFPQEPGALRRFLDEVLGPDDDIALFEYVKRSNRETGPALVGIELGNPDDLDGLLERMERSPMTVEQVDPTSPFYRFLV
ncbi:threonine dehydratase [Enemella evansiae]|nr:threonine dehydratase [Enemella evansiae]OYO08138.1 threonine dehydratase [Enemella evansiae]OYO19051.1 threonine dehydratase [Enemella evansiae]TDO86309.1 L-threonine ammonia-lyase [Enemella evansiae]